jgi:hypothetical protein
MVKTIVFILLCLAGLVWFQSTQTSVYITRGEQHLDYGRGEKSLYFWTSNKHRELFQVGKTYQLTANQQQTQLILSSVTYADIEPDLLKLGFLLPLTDEFTPEAEKYLVSEMKVSTQP